MSIIDKAVKHFNSKQTRQKHIDEWGVVVYAKPLTMEKKGKWLSMAKGSNTDYLLYAVIYGALDKDGNTLFGLEDKHKLKTQVDSDVLSEVATFVLGVDALGADGQSEEEREKN